MNYRNILEVMLAMPADRTVLEASDFKALMKKRELSFIQTIPEYPGAEVWGNRTFNIITIHKNDKFQIL